MNSSKVEYIVSSLLGALAAFIMIFVFIMEGQL